MEPNTTDGVIQFDITGRTFASYVRHLVGDTGKLQITQLASHQWLKGGFLLMTLGAVHYVNGEYRTLSNVDNENQCQAKYGNGTIDNGMRVKREITEAREMIIHFYVYESTLNILGKQNFLDGFETFLNETYMINPEDIFHSEIKVTTGSDFQQLIFVLGPKIENISHKVLQLEKWADDKNSFLVGGFNIGVDQCVHTVITWDGLKTIISFDIKTDDEVFDITNSYETRMQIVNFLTEKFKLNTNQIYDFNSVNTIEGTSRIEFSLAPAMPGLSDLQQEIEIFVNSPCHEDCKQEVISIDSDICSTCDYLRLSNSEFYPVTESLTCETISWTGNEKRFDKEVVNNQGSDRCKMYQESCKNNQGVDVCVGIGRCDPFFYKTAILTLKVKGELALFDILGLDNAIEQIVDTVHDLFGVCKKGLELELFEHGRVSTGMRFRIPPYVGRTDGLKNILHLLDEEDSLTQRGLTITIDGKPTLAYQNIRGQQSFIENGCFGCEKSTVWCLLPEYSLCLPLTTCVEQTTLYPKLANVTELVRVSLLFINEACNITMTEALIEETRKQFADQLNCSLKFLENILIAPAESNWYEMRLDVVNQGSILALEKLVFRLQKVADAGMLYINSSNCYMTSVVKSMLYRQMIYSFTKPKTTTIKQNGDYIIIASFLPLVTVSTFGLIIMCKYTTLWF